MSQDVHHEDFVFRRNALYKTLGIPFEGLRGKAVLEFGPGGGFNAVAVTRYNPELYVFVDASIVIDYWAFMYHVLVVHHVEQFHV